MRRWCVPIAMVPTQNALMRMHWSKRGRMQRNLGWLFLASARGLPIERAVVTVRRSGVKLLDPDNLVASCKLILDALQEARVISGDDPAHLVLRVSQRQVAHRSEQSWEVEVENNDGHA